MQEDICFFSSNLSSPRHWVCVGQYLSCAGMPAPYTCAGQHPTAQYYPCQHILHSRPPGGSTKQEGAQRTSQKQYWLLPNEVHRQHSSSRPPALSVLTPHCFPLWWDSDKPQCSFKSQSNCHVYFSSDQSRGDLHIQKPRTLTGPCIEGAKQFEVIKLSHWNITTIVNSEYY